MGDYRFLIDNDSQAASMYFPQKRVVTFAQAKLNQARPTPKSSRQPVRWNASSSQRTGRTLREIKQFLQKSQRKDCFDLFGLVVIPNPAATPRRGCCRDCQANCVSKTLESRWEDGLAGKLYPVRRPFGWSGGGPRAWAVFLL